MGIEIERKFLVHRDRLPALRDGERIVQGYLSRDPQVRLRVVDGRRVVIAVKNHLSPEERVEFEFAREDLSADEIASLTRLTREPPLVKVRYRVPHAGLVWEIDVYEGENAGLIVADVELASLDHPIEFPDWIDRDREVTRDPRYANINLTREPYRSWEDSAR
ncbi:adenylate cyclase [Candidatus Sumerlaeota bacterium]|nr:adenylate cyclase [Candidatus Sumerlaeota bacterium]